MDRIARAVTPGLVSTVAIIVGLALVVVAVAGSPAPWWAAVGVAAGELLGAGYLVGRNVTVEQATAAPGKPRAMKAA